MSVRITAGSDVLSPPMYHVTYTPPPPTVAAPAVSAGAGDNGTVITATPHAVPAQSPHHEAVMASLLHHARAHKLCYPNMAEWSDGAERYTPWPARVLENRRITHPGHDQDVRHISFDIEGSGIRYHSRARSSVYECDMMCFSVEELMSSLRMHHLS